LEGNSWLFLPPFMNDWRKDIECKISVVDLEHTLYCLVHKDNRILEQHLKGLGLISWKIKTLNNLNEVLHEIAPVKSSKRIKFKKDYATVLNESHIEVSSITGPSRNAIFANVRS
jgi:hypothetical protein